MFISLNPEIPAMPDQSANFFALLNIIGDPAAAKERLEKIKSAQTEAQDVIEAAKTAQAALDTARQEHEQTLKNERAEHDRKLAEAKASFDFRCGLASDEIRSQRASAEKLEKQARADAEAAAALKIDLQRRIDQIKAATA